MSDDSQIFVPPSFIALFVDPGRTRPREPREFIAQRLDLCEDMATMLTEHAQTQLWQLSVTEADVLERMHAGLCDSQSGLSTAEAEWVTRRLAELLGWQCGELPPILPPTG